MKKLLIVAALVASAIIYPAQAEALPIQAETQFEWQSKNGKQLAIVRQVIDLNLAEDVSLWFIVEGARNPDNLFSVSEKTLFGNHIALSKDFNKNTLIIGRHYSLDGDETVYVQIAKPW